MINKEYIKLISELSDKGKLTLFEIVYNMLFSGGEPEIKLSVISDNPNEQEKFESVCDCIIRQIVREDNRQKELQAKRRKAGLASAKKRWGYGKE